MNVNEPQEKGKPVKYICNRLSIQFPLEEVFLLENCRQCNCNSSEVKAETEVETEANCSLRSRQSKHTKSLELGACNQN